MVSLRINAVFFSAFTHKNFIPFILTGVDSMFKTLVARFFIQQTIPPTITHNINQQFPITGRLDSY